MVSTGFYLYMLGVLVLGIGLATVAMRSNSKSPKYANQKNEQNKKQETVEDTSIQETVEAPDIAQEDKQQEKGTKAQLNPPSRKMVHYATIISSNVKEPLTPEILASFEATSDYIARNKKKHHKALKGETKKPFLKRLFSIPNIIILAITIPWMLAIESWVGSLLVFVFFVGPVILTAIFPSSITKRKWEEDDEWRVKGMDDWMTDPAQSYLPGNIYHREL